MVHDDDDDDDDDRDVNYRACNDVSELGAVKYY